MLPLNFQITLSSNLAFLSCETSEVPGLFSMPLALSTSGMLIEVPPISVAFVSLVQAQPRCCHFLWVE